MANGCGCLNSWNSTEQLNCVWEKKKRSAVDSIDVLSVEDDQSDNTVSVLLLKKFICIFHNIFKL